jgi:hypothetical protein
MELDGVFTKGIVALLDSSKVQARFVFASQVIVAENYLSTGASAIP